MKALIIGGGIFGVCAVIELAKKGIEVDLFEKNDRLMREATSANQNRFHTGYHYPRSVATARQCLAGTSSFKEYFGSALLDVNENYYAITEQGSRTSFKQYINFCKKLNLPFEEKFPDEKLLRRSEIAGCIKVLEKVIDLGKLRTIAEGLLKKYRVNVFLEREFKAGDEKEYDFVVNASYSNFNVVNRMLGLPTRTFRYDICNVPIVKLPKELAGIGITIMDGKFYSILPYGGTPYHLFWSVTGSAIRSVSKFPSKKQIIKTANFKDDTYIPLLKHAKLIDVLRVTKILRPDVELSDERLTDLVNYGNGKFAVLSAKINTCVMTARNLARVIKKPSIR